MARNIKKYLVNESPLWISEHKGKMLGIPSISTSTLSNRFCQCKFAEVCDYCYAEQMESYRRTLQEKLKRNSELLSSRMLSEAEVPRFVPGLTVRFNAFGELINRTHLDNLVQIASLNEGCSFGLWTKRYNLTRGLKKPKNLFLVASAYGLDTYEDPKESEAFLKAHPEFNRLFVVCTTGKDINCRLECNSCRVCYRAGGPRVIRENLRHARIKGV